MAMVILREASRAEPTESTVASRIVRKATMRAQSAAPFLPEMRSATWSSE